MSIFEKVFKPKPSWAVRRLIIDYLKDASTLCHAHAVAVGGPEDLKQQLHEAGDYLWELSKQV
jgi:hypothetical protein